MSIDWNQMASYARIPSDPSECSLLWASSANFSPPHWPEGTPSTSAENSSSNERWSLPDDLLQFPDLQLCLGDNPSPPPSPTDTSHDGLDKDKSKRRKEQNRVAQRAYRQRKEKYIKNLLKHIDEINHNHVRLSESYEALRREASRLQYQVEDLKGRLEFWSKAQVVLVKFPENEVPGTAANPPSGLLAGCSTIPQALDPLLNAESAYPVL